MARCYRTEVTALVDALNDEARRDEAAELIRSLVDRIVLTPDPNSKGLLIDLHGDLARIAFGALGRREGAVALEIGQVWSVGGRDASELGRQSGGLESGRGRLAQGPLQIVHCLVVVPGWV